MLPTTIPAYGRPRASCPLLPRHAAETWNVWTSGNRPKSHKTLSLHRNVLLPAEEGLESQALIDR